MEDRWLTFTGKIQVFKSLIASAPIFVATMKLVPESYLSKLWEDFLENLKRPKIKYSTLICDYGQGSQ